MYLKDLFSLNDFWEEVGNGYVRVRNHPELPLSIAKYSEKAAYERKWNDVTLNCRGLIFNSVTHEIVALPWKKFFNYGESGVAISTDDPVEVYDKLDGSLGILYWRGDIFGWDIATVGSFESEQAKVGSDLLTDHLLNGDIDFSTIPSQYTFLFEILYPENRIVVDYKGYRGLVLLGAVNKDYGYYFGPNEAAGALSWKGRVAETFEFKNITDALAADYRPNAEGYVIRSGSTLVKIKQTDYLTLHKIITGTNTKTVWRAFGKMIMASVGIDNKTMAMTLGCSVQELSGVMDLDEIISVVPDEFYDWLDKVKKGLADRYFDLKQEIYNTYFEHMDLADDRKAFAIAIRAEPHKAALFNLLDGKSIIPYCISQIRPDHEKPFKGEE